MNTYKTLTIIVDRANYGRLFPLIERLNNDPRFTNETCFTGTVLLEKNRNLYNSIVNDDKLTPDYCIPVELDNCDYGSMAATVSNIISNFSKLFLRLKPDLVYIIGDRYEAFGCASAAALSHIKIAHIQGGEQSGTIDESLRHAITKLSHLHFPATTKAASNIIQMGEDRDNVHAVGCPMSDYLFALEANFGEVASREHVLCCIHPVTTNLDESVSLCQVLLRFFSEINRKVLWILPNNDPGSKDILDALNQFETPPNVSFASNIPPKKYYQLLRLSIMAIGNSSSYVRDSSMLCTPVILLGTRQNNRELSSNVYEIKNPSVDSLKKAFAKILESCAYKKSYLYGKIGASQQILDHSYSYLERSPSTQKTSFFHG
jgi:UDP-hydrolysing UDP-N-acetyl-D-glucosamine 2-epimerase